MPRASRSRAPVCSITTRSRPAFRTVCAPKTWFGPTRPWLELTACTRTCSAPAASRRRTSNSLCRWTGNRSSKRPDGCWTSTRMADRALAFSSPNSLVMKEQAHAHNESRKILADGCVVGTLPAGRAVHVLDRHHVRALDLLSQQLVSQRQRSGGRPAGFPEGGRPPRRRAAARERQILRSAGRAAGLGLARRRSGLGGRSAG